MHLIKELLFNFCNARLERVIKELLFNFGTLLPARFAEKDLLRVVDHEPVFTYIDDAASQTYPLMEKLRQALVHYALKNASNEKSVDTSVFHRIAAFEDELKERLATEVPAVREAYDTKGISSIPNRSESCRTYPLYRFVRLNLQTQLLSGLRTISPGQEIEKVNDAICQGLHVAPLLQCIEGWTGTPGPFPSC